jgi:putative transposase
LIITDALNYCIAHKGLECFAWVVMSNHLHLIVRAQPPANLSAIIRDFKKYTSKKVIETIQTIGESRREWLLHKFAYAAHSTGRAENFKVWTDDNHAVIMENATMIKQRLNYIHQNPMRQLIVFREVDYMFSSAHDYAGGTEGLVKVCIAN